MTCETCEAGPGPCVEHSQDAISGPLLNETGVDSHSHAGTHSKPLQGDPAFWIEQAERATGMSKESLLLEYEKLGAQPVHYAVTPSAATLARRRMVAAGVPERHIKHVCDVEPTPCHALEKVRAFHAGKGEILILSGAVGTMKSGSACWILGQSDGVYAKAPNLLYLAIEDKPQYWRLSKAKTVVFDDLGTERQDDKGEWIKTFNNLFDDWYGSCARVILTCNISREDFKDRYGERIADRVREAGTFSVIGGDSVRRGLRGER